MYLMYVQVNPDYKTSNSLVIEELLLTCIGILAGLYGEREGDTVRLAADPRVKFIYTTENVRRIIIECIKWRIYAIPIRRTHAW
jgi:hypothetical protein